MMCFNTSKKHQEDVALIQKILASSHQTVTLGAKAPSNTLRNGTYKKNALKIDFSKLNKIIEINENELFAIVEPRITFFELCKETLKLGLIPLVVPEFKTITVGGAIMGAAIES